MKRLSWKYMAGLIDGEGCIDMQTHTHKRDGVFYCVCRLRITLAQESGKTLLLMAKDNFGGCFSDRQREKLNPLWHDVYTWTINGKQMRALLQNIVSHMFIKKEQAKLAIWWVDNVSGKHVPEEIRKDAVNEFKLLKRDPQRLSERAIAEFSKHVIPKKSWLKRTGVACAVCGTIGLDISTTGKCYKCRGIVPENLAVDAIVHPDAVVAA